MFSMWNRKYRVMRARPLSVNLRLSDNPKDEESIMNTFIKVKLCFTILLCCAGGLLAQLEAPPSEFGVPASEFERVGQAGWQFLKIPASARQAAVAGVKSGLGSASATTVFNNPAEMVLASGTQLSFTDNSWFADIHNQAFAVSRSFGAIGTFGVGINYVDYGDMIRTDISQMPSPNPDVTGTEYVDKLISEGLGSFSANDMALGLSYARQVTDRLSFGSTVRYLRSKIDDLTMDNFSLDVGTTFHTGIKSLRIAMLARNFGPDSRFFDFNEKVNRNPTNIKLPTQFRFSMAYDLLERVEGSPHLLTMVVEGLHANDGPEKWNTGAEYTFMSLLSLRGGYRFNYDEEGLTLGAGINVNMGMDFSVDYAYLDFGRLEEVHMFSLNLGL
ncbi:PorV/PorQ family protein [candidate division KSB1 bacterium]|nr:PorV/PorQ family protein [candidate division KSB1 bacterium]